MLRIYETFLSLQGESSHAGKVCFFIRLAGCNLRCSYCDTCKAQPADAGTLRSVEELVQLAVESGADTVEVTGGEPMLQEECVALLQGLLDAGKTVLMETNGSVPLDAVPEKVCRIIDWKLPSSGMDSEMCRENFRNLRPHDEVKFVIGSREDFLAAKAVAGEFAIAEQTPHILYSPVWGAVAFADLAAWIIAENMPGQMQLQMHKLIWGATAEGV
ncbi:MAG: radical SAM protein [Lentisphaeria bacterium]|nr:radical SAM protein [Lentisphaeria bacterium]